jgi:hypothetical protein
LWWLDYPTQISNFYSWTRNCQKVKPALLETNFRALRFGIAKHYECKNKDGRDFHGDLDEPTEIVRVLWALMAQPYSLWEQLDGCLPPLVSTSPNLSGMWDILDIIRKERRTHGVVT